MIGEAEGVIAGRGGDDAGAALGVSESQELVASAPLLEAAGHLEMFKFAIDFAGAEAA